MRRKEGVILSSTTATANNNNSNSNNSNSNNSKTTKTTTSYCWNDRESNVLGSQIVKNGTVGRKRERRRKEEKEEERKRKQKKKKCLGKLLFATNAFEQIHLRRRGLKLGPVCACSLCV
jgi:hypothetical protein